MRKIRVLDRELPSENLHFIRGKDLILYLYLELDRKHSSSDFHKFNRLLMFEAVKVVGYRPDILKDLHIYDLM